MIKVNQISNIQQVERLQKRIDIGGVCISKSNDIKAPYIDLNTAIRIKDTLPGLSLSVSFCASDSYDVSEMSDILEVVKAEYFEFDPIDPIKKEQFNAQLKSFKELKIQKIANSFFIMKEDCSFIKDIDPLQKLSDIGVVLFQFEVNSAVDYNFMISKRDLADAEMVFSQFPALVCDRIKQTQNYPLRSVAGFYFNIKTPSKEEISNYSQLTWSESEIIRILMKKGRASGTDRKY